MIHSIMGVRDVERIFHVGTETVHALKKVSMDVDKGVLSIIGGRSGSGKTTLLNILGSLDRPDGGRVFFENHDITDVSEEFKNTLRRERIGFVFQSVALIPLLSAFENVEFGLRVAGYPMGKRRARAEECLELVGLGRRMYHMPQQLSGGELQRVAIARAMAHKPSVIFADEPTAELDTKMGLHVVKLLRKMVEQEGMTIVMTTHDPGIMEYADRLFMMQDGEISIER